MKPGICWWAAFILTFCGVGFSQIVSGDKEISAHGVAPVKARSTDALDVLKASLEMVLQDKDVCCGKDSALEDTLERVDPHSLQDIANKIQGRHLLSDGRPIKVSVEYLSPDQINAGHMLLMLGHNHVVLIAWDSHVYLLDGMTYVESADSDGNITYVIHTFSMQDPRYEGARRRVIFDRTKQDPAKIQGMLFAESVLQ